MQRNYDVNHRFFVFLLAALVALNAAVFVPPSGRYASAETPEIPLLLPVRGHVEVGSYTPGTHDHIGQYDYYAVDFTSDKPNVYPTAPGTVRYVKKDSCDLAKTAPEGSDCYGSVIVIDHGNGLYSIYAHLSNSDFPRVKEGNFVNYTTRIGTMGETGCKSQCGVHLHFAVREGPPLLEGRESLWNTALHSYDVWGVIPGLPVDPKPSDLPLKIDRSKGTPGPGGRWITPRINGQIVTSSTLTLSARAYPATGSTVPVAYVNFTIVWPGGNWRLACPPVAAPSKGDRYDCTADLEALGAPEGQRLTVSFDVYDRNGISRLAPEGTHTILWRPNGSTQAVLAATTVAEPLPPMSDVFAVGPVEWSKPVAAPVATQTVDVDSLEEVTPSNPVTANEREGTGRVEFYTISCPGPNSLSASGPGFFADIGMSCTGHPEPGTLVLTDDSGRQQTVDMSTDPVLDLEFGDYQILDPATGLTATLEVFPNEGYYDQCDFNECWWWIVIVNQSSDTAPSEPIDTGSAGTGHVKFWVLDCGGSASLTADGPLMNADPGQCNGSRDPIRFVITSSSGEEQVVDYPATTEVSLEFGSYEVRESSSGLMATLDVVPNQTYLDRCGDGKDCAMFWLVVFERSAVPSSSEGMLTPQELAGSWSGHASQQNPTSDWDITIDISGGKTGSVIGRSSYPGLGCEGELVFQSVTSSHPPAITLSEHIVNGAGVCVDGTIELTYIGPDEGVNFEWTSNTGSGRAFGILHDTDGDAGPSGSASTGSVTAFVDFCPAGIDAYHAAPGTCPRGDREAIFLSLWSPDAGYSSTLDDAALNADGSYTWAGLPIANYNLAPENLHSVNSAVTIYIPGLKSYVCDMQNCGEFEPGPDNVVSNIVDTGYRLPLPASAPDQTIDVFVLGAPGGQGATTCGDCGISAPGTVSIEIHAAQCPAGYSGSDYYNDCHGNGEAGIVFSVSNADGTSQQVTTQIETSPGPGIARANGLDLGVFSVSEPFADPGETVYVFCSPDQGATVLADQLTSASEGVSLALDAGTALVCDWYSLS